MSLTSSKQIMVQSAAYFEKKGKFDKAVTLYSRGGNKKKAMDIAIKYNYGHLIEGITSDVSTEDDPDVLSASVQFLLQNKQYDKAVEIMISLGKNDEALELAEKQNILIKEENAIKLVPSANEKDPYKSKQRRDIALRLAKLSKR